MDRTVVIYKGKYGATKQYAQWIAEELSCDIIEADRFLKRDFDNYDNIIYGGAIRAGGIKGFEVIKKNRKNLSGKKLVIFAVGLSIESSKNRIQVREINLDKRELSALTVYYCKGAYDPSKIKGAEKIIMDMTKSMIEKKPESQRTEEEAALLKDITEGADYVDKKYIEPIVAEFKGVE